MSAIFAHSNELTPVKVARRTEAEAWYDSPYSPFIGEIINKPNKPLSGLSEGGIPGTPIVKYTEFATAGTDTVYVPMRRRLTGSPIYGDLDFFGTEEQISWYRHALYVNAIQHAVDTNVGRMTDLRAKELKQALEAEAALKEWYSDILTLHTTKAFYEGYSPNIVASAVTGGYAVSKRHHPNFMVAGTAVANTTSAWVDWSATVATYEDYIAVALADMDGAATPENAFSAKLLRKLRADLLNKRIMPMVRKGGKRLWVMFVDSLVMAQALEDTQILAATQAAFTGRGGNDDPILMAGDLYYNGFVIKEHNMVGQEVHQTGSTSVAYGPVSTGVTELNQIAYAQSSLAADQNMHVSLVMGNHALSMGQVGRLMFEPKEKDYFKDSVGASLIWGAARNDIYDNIGTITAVLNFSSAVVATNSPPQ